MGKTTLYILLFLGLNFSNSNSWAQCHSTADFSVLSNGRHLSFINRSYLDSNSQALYEWDFGDSSSQYTTNTNTIYHSYTRVDTFKVQLILHDSINSCSDTAQKFIPVNFKCMSIFDVRTHLDSGFFKYTGVDTNLNFAWRFHDTSYYTKDVNRAFTQPGNYRVSLEITDSNNLCSDSSSALFTIDPFCKAGFSYSISNDTVEFTNKASNFFWLDWTFGDGTTSMSFNSSKIYSQGGRYVVCQTVSDSSRQCIDTFCDTLTICTTSFTYSISQDTVLFTNSSTFNDVSWNFGDGTTSNAQNPMHIYDSSGTYVVCQTVNDSINQCNSTFCDTIVIKVPAPCQAGFNYNLSNDSVKFTSTAVNYDSIYWDFGDGSTASVKDPLHIYNSIGRYVACQEVYNSQRVCSSVECDTIDVIFCNASFSFSVNDSQVTFSNNSNNLNANFLWDFGDGSYSSSVSPKHIYRSTGNYTVRLSMTDSSGGVSCNAEYTDSLYVEVICNAHYNIAIDSNQLFKIYLINNSSNYNNHIYHWDFGDGGTANTRTPKHKYNAFGKYRVCLSIEDSILNCTSTFCDSLGLDSNGVLLRGGFLLEVIDQSVIGIQENEILKNINIYPNPVNEMLNIDLREIAFEVKLTLFDSSGRLIIVKECKGNTIEKLELERFQSGIYLLNISDKKNNQIFKKIILNK